MKIRTLATMLTLLVAGLAIGCSSAPKAPAAPAAPVANLTEKEAIGIARSYHYKHRIPGPCWLTQHPYPNSDFVNFSHTESASFKASGIWVVTSKAEWGDMTDVDTHGGWLKMPSDYITDEHPFTYVVDYATGRVAQD